MDKKIHIRPETRKDYPGITRVNDLAFGRSNESRLVKALRKLTEFDSRVSLVAELQGGIIGHVVLLPILIKAEQQTHPSLSLGPISVHPTYQKQGIGGELIQESHHRALELGYTSVILIGHPTYYPRFGYRMASLWGLRNPWGIHNEVFMAIELVAGSLDGKSGLALYPEAFTQAT